MMALVSSNLVETAAESAPIAVTSTATIRAVITAYSTVSRPRSSEMSLLRVFNMVLLLMKKGGVMPRINIDPGHASHSLHQLPCRRADAAGAPASSAHETILQSRSLRS